MFALAAVLTATALAHPGFSAHIDNPYFPLLTGMRWEYRGKEERHPSRDVVRVTGRIRVIEGVPCMAIDDRVFLDGRLAERTTDWYTQGPHGTVWYYGERTAELDRHGRVTSREGSWRAGVDGARPGIYMPAHPRVGEEHAQEHYAGHAEDRFRVVHRAGPFLATREFTRLEPGIRDGKWYVKGIGQVREATLKGPQEYADLVSFHR
jgi:hypothetical protein